MKKLKKIGVMSLAKVMGLLYAIMGLILGALFSLSASYMPPAQPYPLSVIFGSAAIVALPIVYGIMGFVSGLIGAALYNVIAKKVCPIEVDIK